MTTASARPPAKRHQAASGEPRRLACDSILDGTTDPPRAFLLGGIPPQSMTVRNTVL